MIEKKIRDIVQRMLDTEFIFNKEKTTIRDYLDDLVEIKKERINWSSYKKFCLFATCL